MTDPDKYRRAITYEDTAHWRPVHVVWEITLACDLHCIHCGSRAGARRPDELDTQECLAIIDKLAELGCREINLIGGEAYLRKDWTQLIERICEHGIYCAIQSGARNLTDKRLRQAQDAGLRQLGVSIDGLEQAHDRQRGLAGSWAKAFDAIRRARALGIEVTANTQINHETIDDLEELFEQLTQADVQGWQLQLTVAMGRAAERPELLLQPYELLALMPRLAALWERGQALGIRLIPGNNLGYYGPFERLWRQFDGDESMAWSGCMAGRAVMGIEADGTIKGCPSLPTQPFAGGNIRDLDLETIWRAPQIRPRPEGRQGMWGFCKSCYYAEICQAGCTWTSHVLFGKRGNNPYCHHRALTLEAMGLRERIELAEHPPGTPFDYGRYQLLLESLDGQPLENPHEICDPYAEELDAQARSQRELTLCHSCDCHVRSGTEHCPFCEANIAAAAQEHRANLRSLARQKQQALDSIRELIGVLQDETMADEPSTSPLEGNEHA